MLSGIISSRNAKLSAFAGSILALSFAIVNPALENTLSEGAEVAGTHNILRARVASLGNL